jgi:hypothetical protein
MIDAMFDYIGVIKKDKHTVVQETKNENNDLEKNFER